MIQKAANVSQQEKFFIDSAASFDQQLNSQGFANIY